MSIFHELTKRGAVRNTKTFKEHDAFHEGTHILVKNWDSEPGFPMRWAACGTPHSYVWEEGASRVGFFWEERLPVEVESWDSQRLVLLKRVVSLEYSHIWQLFKFMLLYLLGTALIHRLPIPSCWSPREDLPSTKLLPTEGPQPSSSPFLEDQRHQRRPRLLIHFHTFWSSTHRTMCRSISNSSHWMPSLTS